MHKFSRCVATMPKRSCVTSDCDSCKVECSRNGVFSLATLVKIYPDNMDEHVLYHISLEHGFNVLVMVVPFDVPGKKCISTECPKDPNRICPPKLRWKKIGKQWHVRCLCCVQLHDKRCFVALENWICVSQVSTLRYLGRHSLRAFNLPCIGDNTTTFECSSTDYNIVFCPDIERINWLAWVLG